MRNIVNPLHGGMNDECARVGAALQSQVTDGCRTPPNSQRPALWLWGGIAQDATNRGNDLVTVPHAHSCPIDSAEV